MFTITELQSVTSDKFCHQTSSSFSWYELRIMRIYSNVQNYCIISITEIIHFLNKNAAKFL